MAYKKKTRTKDPTSNVVAPGPSVIPVVVQTEDNVEDGNDAGGEVGQAPDYPPFPAPEPYVPGPIPPRVPRAEKETMSFVTKVAITIGILAVVVAVILYTGIGQ